MKPAPGSKIYQTKTLQFSLKNALKTLKMYNFSRFRHYLKFMQGKFTVLHEMVILKHVFRSRYQEPNPKAILIGNIDERFTHYCLFCKDKI